ncbi:hypothetical protein L1887_60034 [Cichorium endivia]|nr:hypothetical protein L1887_60034 [Cichorium endivia]
MRKLSCGVAASEHSLGHPAPRHAALRNTHLERALLSRLSEQLHPPTSICYPSPLRNITSPVSIRTSTERLSAHSSPHHPIAAAAAAAAAARRRPVQLARESTLYADPHHKSPLLPIMSALWSGWGADAFTEQVEKATSELLPVGSEDIALNLDICDQVRAKQVPAKQACRCSSVASATRTQMSSFSPWVLTDICIKNGGDHFLQEVASREFMDNLVSVLRSPAGVNNDVKAKALGLIQNWSQIAQAKPAQMAYIIDIYRQLKSDSAFDFPPLDPNASRICCARRDAHRARMGRRRRMHALQKPPSPPSTASTTVATAATSFASSAPATTWRSLGSASARTYASATDALPARAHPKTPQSSRDPRAPVPAPHTCRRVAAARHLTIAPPPSAVRPVSRSAAHAKRRKTTSLSPSNSRSKLPVKALRSRRAPKPPAIHKRHPTVACSKEPTPTTIPTSPPPSPPVSATGLHLSHQRTRRSHEASATATSTAHASEPPALRSAPASLARSGRSGCGQHPHLFPIRTGAPPPKSALRHDGHSRTTPGAVAVRKGLGRTPQEWRATSRRVTAVTMCSSPCTTNLQRQSVCTTDFSTHRCTDPPSPTRPTRLATHLMLPPAQHYAYDQHAPSHEAGPGYAPMHPGAASLYPHAPQARTRASGLPGRLASGIRAGAHPMAASPRPAHVFAAAAAPTPRSRLRRSRSTWPVRQRIRRSSSSTVRPPPAAGYPNAHYADPQATSSAPVASSTQYASYAHAGGMPNAPAHPHASGAPLRRRVSLHRSAWRSAIRAGRWTRRTAVCAYRWHLGRGGESIALVGRHVDVQAATDGTPVPIQAVAPPMHNANGHAMPEAKPCSSRRRSQHHSSSTSRSNSRSNSSQSAQNRPLLRVNASYNIPQQQHQQQQHQQQQPAKADTSYLPIFPVAPHPDNGFGHDARAAEAASPMASPYTNAPSSAGMWQNGPGKSPAAANASCRRVAADRVLSWPFKPHRSCLSNRVAIHHYDGCRLLQPCLLSSDRAIASGRREMDCDAVRVCSTEKHRCDTSGSFECSPRYCLLVQSRTRI